MNKFFTKYQKYLPSKPFAIFFGVVFVVAIIIVVLFFVSSKKEIFTGSGAQANSPLVVENQTVTSLVNQDSDGDGISDWEETLWGTDKNKKITFNNTPDSTYIDNKKKELNIEGSVNVNKLTETDKFAREFFSTFTAMKASGQVDSDTINGFSNALGQKVANPNLVDQYTEKDVKIDTSVDNNDPTHKLAYYTSLERLLQSYKTSGIGDELDIVNSGLTLSPTTTPDSFAKLPIIANAYQDFAQKVMDLTVPSELATFHLQIANSAHNTGISVQNMSQIISDPLIGLEGLSQYQKYSDALVKAVEDLSTAVTQ